MSDITRTRVPENCDFTACQIEEYGVYSWTPELDGKGVLEQVHLHIKIKGLKPPLVMRFKSRRAIQEMIDALVEHRNHVWPVKE